MARVLLATLRGAGGFEKKLVVKQIRDELAFDQQFVRRFVEEAKTTVALSHPNIVPVYELGVEQGTYFLAMELVLGVSITELLRQDDGRGGPRVLSPEEGAYVGMEVCRALEYAHRRMRVVHRDITPRNVMLDEEGQVKLIDFGIAAPSRVAGQEILGSPGHMPPEQIEGKELGPATDVFAIAVVLMEAWTGVAPFRRGTPEECWEAMKRPYPRPSDFDPRLLPLDEPIARAMSLDPRERQQDASELGRAFRSFLQGVDIADLARGLGDRVHALRSGATEEASPPSIASARASSASHAEIGTKTFAAREEALGWPSTPPSAAERDVPTTRRLDDAPPSSADLPALAPVPSTRRISSEPPPSVRADRESVATRPLETPASLVPPPSTPPPTARAWTRRVGSAVLLAGALAALTLAIRGRGTTVTTPTAEPASSPVVAASAAQPPVVREAPPTPAPAEPATSAVASPLPASSIVAAAPAPSVGASAPSSRVVARPSAGATTAAPSGAKAQVTLLGDPGTRVSIDGSPRGPCPQRLTLEPGQHEASFVFDPTGEGRSVRLGVTAGERITVRADFTSVTPSVKIQR